MIFSLKGHIQKKIQKRSHWVVGLGSDWRMLHNLYAIYNFYFLFFFFSVAITSLQLASGNRQITVEMKKKERQQKQSYSYAWEEKTIRLNSDPCLDRWLLLLPTTLLSWLWFTHTTPAILDSSLAVRILHVTTAILFFFPCSRSLYHNQNPNYRITYMIMMIWLTAIPFPYLHLFFFFLLINLCFFFF